MNPQLLIVNSLIKAIAPQFKNIVPTNPIAKFLNVQLTEILDSNEESKEIMELLTKIFVSYANTNPIDVQNRISMFLNEYKVFHKTELMKK